MRGATIISMALSLSITGLVLARSEDPRIGRRVFTQFGTVLKVGKQVVDDEGRSDILSATGRDRALNRVYRVEHVNGDWLWLKDEKSGVAGWARSRSVIPYEQAVDYFTDRIRAAPHSSLYNSRGMVWREKGEYVLAFADFDEAIRLDPEDAKAYYNRGNARIDKKDYQRAIADFDEAIRLDPKLSLAFHNRGFAWLGRKDYGKALADFDEAVRLDPKSALALNSRAWLRAACPDGTFRDGKKAVESASLACGFSGWKDPEHLDTLAAAHAEAGDFDEAVKRQAQANGLFADAESRKKGESRLVLYRARRPYRDEG